MATSVNYEPEIMTIKELRAYLQIHEMTAYRLAKKGEFPSFRVGKNWRFRKSDIEKYIEGKMGK